MSMEAMRGPKNSKSWSGPGFDPRILTLTDGIALRCDVNYGQGTTEVEIKVLPANFAELAEAMIAVDRSAAAKAFGLALASGFDDEPGPPTSAT
jgi:hypothetical protein